MNVYPTEPNAGDKISATLIRDIVRCLRRITPMAGSGVKLRVTPNGTYLSAQASVATSAAASERNDCWKLAWVEVGTDGTKQLRLENQYFQIGGIIRKESLKKDLSEFVMQGELGEGQEYTEDDKPFVFLDVLMDKVGSHSAGTATIDAVKTEAELLERSGDINHYVKPLYKLTHDAGIAIDMRNMPQIASYEIPSALEIIE